MKNQLFQIFVCFLFSFTASQSQEAFYIKDFQVSIDVKEDATFNVTEEIFVHFTEKRRGIIRSLPFRYNVEGKDHSIYYRNIEVDLWNYTTYSEGDNKNIRIGKEDVFLTGDQRYTIHYTVSGAYLWHDQNPEFYWNVIGTEWEVPIKKSSFLVSFPASMSISEENYQLHSGTAGGTGHDFQITLNGNEIRGNSTDELAPGEGVTLAVLVPAGIIQKPISGWSRLTHLPLAGALLAVLLSFWWRYGKSDFKKTKDNIYHPPHDFNAAMAGALIDRKINTRDLLSLLSEWANQGYIQMIQTEEKGIRGKPDIIIERLKTLPNSHPEYQQTLFNGMFKESDFVLLTELKNKMYMHLAKAHRQLKREAKKLDIYDLRSYSFKKQGWFLLMAAVFLILSILHFVLWKQYWTGVLMLPLAVTSFIMYWMPVRFNKKGNEIKHILVNLRDFLRDPDPKIMDRLLKEDAQYLQKMLPFAVAFGLDKTFIRKTQSYYDQYGPFWFWIGTRDHHHRATYHDFSNSFDTRAITSAFVSNPNQQSGSGTSFGGGGGGSVGGGFGGGGGSSW